jgi:GNAT superfamily N-acetyltransferase
MSSKPTIAKLASGHNVAAFSCGKAPLDEFLKKFALPSQRSDSSQTYVVAEGGVVIGYYSLSTCQVEYNDAPERLKKGLSRNPVPSILIGRWAVDKLHQGRGVGLALMKHAIYTALDVAEIVGSRALIVDAKDEEALAGYLRMGFERFPHESMRCYWLFKDLRAMRRNETQGRT